MAASLAISAAFFMVTIGGALLPVGGPAQAQEPRAVLTLEGCVNLAIRQNPLARAALAEIEEAVGLTMVARAGIFPRLTTNAYFQYRESDFGDSVDFTTLQERITFAEQLAFALDNPGTDFPRPIGRGSEIRNEDYNITVRLSHSLYSGGRIRAQIAIAKLREQERFYQYQGVVNGVILQTRLAFYDVLRARELLRIQRESLARKKQEVELQEGQFEAGVVGELNVMRAQVSLTTTRPAIINAEAMYERALVRLAAVMGMPLDPETGTAPLHVEGNLGVVAPTIDLPNALGRATALRPEVAAQRRFIEQLQQQVTVARSGILPRVDLFGSYEFYSELNKNLPNPNVSTYTAGVSGSWRIFDGMQAAGEIQSVRASIEAEEHRLQEFMVRIESEVRSAFIQYHGALAAYRAARESAALAMEVWSSVRESYDAGLSSQLEILQAQNEITGTERVVLDAQHQLNMAIAELDAAIGLDVEFLFDGEEAP